MGKEVKLVKTHVDDSPQHITAGDTVYLTEQYFIDSNASYAEVPRFGWVVKSVVEGRAASIECERPQLKMQITLLVDTKYLKRLV